MEGKPIIISIVAALLIIGGAVYFSGSRDALNPSPSYVPRATTPTDVESAPVTGTATVIDGTQYIDITARGGYSPRVTTAKAGMPTIIRMKTENTFDCSSALVIPTLGFSSYLDRTGVKEIPVPTDKAQGTLKGLCSMGMYTFEVDFQ